MPSWRATIPSTFLNSPAKMRLQLLPMASSCRSQRPRCRPWPPPSPAPPPRLWDTRTRSTSASSHQPSAPRSSLRGPCPNSRLPPLHHPGTEQAFQNLHHIENAFSSFHCIPGFHPYAWLGLQGFVSPPPGRPLTLVLLIPHDSATRPLPEFMTPPPLRVFVQHFPPELVLFIPQAQLACPGCELST